MQLGNVTLRDVQVRAIAQARAAVARCKQRGVEPRVLIVAPCGAGKTITSSAIMAGGLEKGIGSLFLASGRQLIFQKSRAMDRCGVPHGVLMGEEPYYPSQCVVASFDTYFGRTFKRGTHSQSDARLVIVDEAHLAMGGSWQKAFAAMPADTVFIGLTATPVLGDGRGLGGFWREMVIATTYAEMLRDGILVPARVFAPWTIDTTKLGSKSDGDWSQGRVEGAFNKRELVGDIVASYRRLGGNRPFACFASGVEHSIALAGEFNANNIACTHIDANTPQDDRERAFRSVESGELKGLCNFGVLGTGFDLPVLGCGILAFASDSLRKVIQVCGRLVRSSPGKRDCIIIDHGSNIYRHGWPTADRDWQLDPSETIREREAKKPATEDKPREPICCPKCGAMRDSGRKCPECGHEHKRSGMKVMTVDGTLKELKPKDVKKKREQSDTAKAWLQCLAAMAWRDGTIKQAMAIFKQKTGQWPDGLSPVPDRSQWDMRVNVVYPGFVKRKAKT